ncbi:MULTISPECIES: hypothetical protein [Acetobacteraceae]|uniref:hypothetical protein n=1 Tax=Acetobacteraceae TaxID=433 RepID=UPI0018D9675B|nr:MULTISPECIES: hypothetical protein [Acetobacteraceae]MBR9730695.1 hypothetical protein [Bombella apis]
MASSRSQSAVAVSYLPQEDSDAREVAVLIQKAGRKAVFLPGDIRKETTCQKIVHRAVLDAVAGLWRSAAVRRAAFRGGDTLVPSRTAGGDCAGLCHPGLSGEQLRDRAGLGHHRR